MELKIKLLSPDAVIPTRANPGDAGLDLTSVEDYVLRPGERKLFKTDVAMRIPPGYYGHICGRSGLAYKNGIAVLGGIIDESFSGNVGVILLNTQSKSLDLLDMLARGTGSIEITKGQKIAQIIIQPYISPDIVLVDELEESLRGSRGFGSSDNIL